MGWLLPQFLTYCRSSDGGWRRGGWSPVSGGGLAAAGAGGTSPGTRTAGWVRWWQWVLTGVSKG